MHILIVVLVAVVTTKIINIKRGRFMFKAVFFDLDGTLLPFDLHEFIKEYFHRLATDFSQLYPPKTFQGYVQQATKAMVKDNRKDVTNQQVFLETFLPLVNHSEEEIMSLFEQFYSSTFNDLKQCTFPTPMARQVVSVLAEKGYRLVLATNPLFPEIATRARMEWANIADLPWELVTSYENSHFCKPNPAYYTEILEKTGLQPSEVMHVGNDPLEDLVAGQLGIKTYLVTDWLVPRESKYQPDARGTMTDFYQSVNNNFQGLFS